jgi:hypothetical protein
MPPDVGKHIASYLHPEYKFGDTAAISHPHELSDLGRAHARKKYAQRRNPHMSSYEKGLHDKEIQKHSSSLKGVVDKTAKHNYERHKDTMHAWLWDDSKRDDIKSEYDPYAQVQRSAKAIEGMDLDMSTMMPMEK